MADSMEMVDQGQSSFPSQGPNPIHKPISDPSLLPKKRSQISGACSNLVNSIVGAGIIGIPFALEQSGLVSGVILLLLVGYFTDKSLRMIVNLATSSSSLKGRGVWTYDDLMGLPFGSHGRSFVLISMFVTAYGAMVAYLLIIKDTLPVVMGLVDDGDASVGGFWEREVVMLVTSLLVVVPLSMQRDFSSLAFTSSISVGADIMLVGFVAAVAPIKKTVSAAGGLGSVIKNSIIDKGFFIGFGVLTVAMCCQHSAFIVASSLDNPTPRRWSIVSGVSLWISVICCLVLGVSGYLAFLDDTQGDVLNNFGVDTNSANAARSLLALTMFFTYPMEAFVARHVLVQLLWKGDMDGYIADTVVNAETGEETTSQRKAKCCNILNRRHQVTFLIYILTLIPALIVDDLGPVLSITGAVGGCCLAYIGPGLVYLGVHGEDFLQRLANRILTLNTSKPMISSAAEAEANLPIEGDATAQISSENSPLPAVDPRQVFSKEYISGYKKPWWWFVLGMPLWVKVALKGSAGMAERLLVLDEEEYRLTSPISENATDSSGDKQQKVTLDHSPPAVINGNDTADIVEPSLVDYGFAIFFVIFGAIALVAGLASNVYVQINEIFNIPA
mmetsp:Transcript_12689/g.35915  ORF Transcript_12689/g.35915 Transcript_12689/m.35915 type:complete len:615 (+) Transcript_12689:220-2064(+)|eukprot:CAMPEP_0172364206 /NCGR_PEP_ID=MMETSP1060-20121228/7384_1 /TAXON_ID=37318 /ORGANISM="Pseudo-nitzschia pungens, Strain cf. cingulata" /LENGTH=614 /DNA_ID=CAMNT_0013087159 /DNA_START=199 /DNA_END=2043 /DNA_ORIENTATION=-